MHILLVEDDVRLARSYQRNLEDDGHSVAVEHDGDAALARALSESERFDAIILDVLLPRRSGIAVCRELRRAGVATPILLLTALDQTEDKVAGLDAGADDYLTKPFPFEELLARLRALGRRPHQYDPAAGAARVVIDTLIIDRLRHKVYRDDRPITLTAREFALLDVLARNLNRVVTRQHLMASIWSDGSETASNVLDTYIHYLRDKIDRGAKVQLIRTVRGVGYMLSAS
jgi:DNA-binding response OmpR family regulator